MHRYGGAPNLANAQRNSYRRPVCATPALAAGATLQPINRELARLVAAA
jgi:hypothetical protein